MPEEKFSSLKKAGTSIQNLLKVLLLIGFVGFLGYFYLFAVVGIPFYTTHRLFYFIVMNMLFFGLLGLFICAVSKKRSKKFLLIFGIGLSFDLFALCISGDVGITFH